MLRPPGEVKLALDRLLCEETIALLGSKYSIDSLRNSIETRFHDALPDTFRSWYLFTSFRKLSFKFFTWSSSPEDLASKMELSDKWKLQIEKAFPNFNTKLNSRSYYCSKLVADVLHAWNLIADKHADITPTGLLTLLRENDWMDITESEYSSMAIHKVANDDCNRARLRAKYEFYIGLSKLSSDSVAVGEAGRLAQAAVDRMNGTLHEALNKISSWSDPKKLS